MRDLIIESVFARLLGIFRIHTPPSCHQRSFLLGFNNTSLYQHGIPASNLPGTNSSCVPLKKPHTDCALLGRFSVDSCAARVRDSNMVWDSSMLRRRAKSIQIGTIKFIPTSRRAKSIQIEMLKLPISRSTSPSPPSEVKSDFTSSPRTPPLRTLLDLSVLSAVVM